MNKEKIIADIEKYEWSDWKSFPNPINYGQKISLRLIFRELLANPKDPGVYQVRDIKYKNIQEGVDQLILFGEGGCLEERMGSLLPQNVGGVGTRNNQEKRNYIWKNLENCQYRVLYVSKIEAVKIDKKFQSLEIHRYNT